MTAHDTTFSVESNPPSGIMRRGGRPRVWTPIGDTGYAVHPDGRIRDKHYNIITNPAIVAALIPPKAEPTAWFRLACCGQRVRADRPSTAAEHWSDCLQDMHATGSPRNAPAGRLKPDRYYSRDVYRRRAPRHADLDEPIVLAHRGERVRTMSWVMATRIIQQKDNMNDGKQ